MVTRTWTGASQEAAHEVTSGWWPSKYRTYNGFRLADIVGDHGTSRLGIDTLPQVVTPGLLPDVAARARGWRRWRLREPS